jgi:hypothetical protein
MPRLSPTRRFALRNATILPLFPAGTAAVAPYPNMLLASGRRRKRALLDLRVSRQALKSAHSARNILFDIGICGHQGLYYGSCNFLAFDLV